MLAEGASGHFRLSCPTCLQIEHVQAACLLFVVAVVAGDINQKLTDSDWVTKHTFTSDC